MKMTRDVGELSRAEYMAEIRELRVSRDDALYWCELGAAEEHRREGIDLMRARKAARAAVLARLDAEVLTLRNA